MTPKSPSVAEPVEHPLSAEEEKRVQAGVEASELDEAMALTPAEADAYYETGVLSERVKTWVASRG
jgi:hypothetical protein